MVFIYVLQLKEEKWYIGKTESSKFRIDTHFDSKGSGFTKKYHPEQIYQIIPECDKYDEDKYVKKYMDKYGINNVRGGSFSRLELTEEEKKSIQKELWGANDLCFLCGGDHFVKDCPNKQIEESETNEEYIIDQILLKKIKQDSITNNCFTLHIDFQKTSFVTPNRNMYNRTYFDEYFSFDTYTISEYVNNDKNIMCLYKEYVYILTNNLKIQNNTAYKSRDFSDRIKLYQILHNLNDKIKKLIKDLCYLKINKIIETEFHKDYILSNFKLNINFDCEKVLYNKIHYNYYIEDCLKKKIDVSHLVSNDPCLRKKQDYKRVEQIATIHTTGELFYKNEEWSTGMF